jgi:hypothetical protein
MKNPVVVDKDKLIVDDDIADFNKYDKPLYHQCQHVTNNPPLYGSYWNRETTRCGGDSMYLITYAGGTTGQIYTKHLCSQHSIEFLNNCKKYFENNQDALNKIDALLTEMEMKNE